MMSCVKSFGCGRSSGILRKSYKQSLTLLTELSFSPPALPPLAKGCCSFSCFTSSSRSLKSLSSSSIRVFKFLSSDIALNSQLPEKRRSVSGLPNVTKNYCFHLFRLRARWGRPWAWCSPPCKSAAGASTPRRWQWTLAGPKSGGRYCSWESPTRFPIFSHLLSCNTGWNLHKFYCLWNSPTVKRTRNTFAQTNLLFQ